MTSTEDRIRNLINENLEIDGSALDLNGGLTDAGVSSMDLVAFAKVVAKEFNVAFTPDDCANLKSIRELIERLDASQRLALVDCSRYITASEELVQVLRQVAAASDAGLK